jgi:hypothetical protein
MDPVEKVFFYFMVLVFFAAFFVIVYYPLRFLVHVLWPQSPPFVEQIVDAAGQSCGVRYVEYIEGACVNGNLTSTTVQML